jgi:hypothetical protein
MNTQKMLSTVTLFALPLLSAGLAAAGQEPRAVPTPALESPAAVDQAALEDVLVRRSIAVGFAQNQPLHDALRKRLSASPSGRFAVRERQQIPATATGLFVSGFVSDSGPEHGFLNCHARYFVVSQPSLTALQVESVAASVPIMQVQIFKDRPELLELAAESCASELADEIAVRLEKLPR